MTIDQARTVHAMVAEGRWEDGASYVLGLLGKPGVNTKPQAVKVLQGLFQHLLDTDQYLHAATLQWGPDMFNTEPESTVRVFKALNDGALILLMGASSMSKCVSPDQGVIMFDGSVRAAKDVKVGDLLMGDDSKPRRVLKSNSGYGPLFRINPERGKPWICNDAHILSLRVGAHKLCGNSGKPQKKWRKGDVIDIPIGEYNTLSKDKKARLRQFHVGVEFAAKPLPFDPYIYGAWIGDGAFDVPALHTPDGPMARRWCEYFNSLPGFRVSSAYHDACPMWCARMEKRGNNPFLDFIRTSRRNGEKIILDDYLINSRENRLKLLAGLIDSDGWVSCKTGYQFVSKHEHLATQVSRLARSLGFGSTVTPRIHSIKSIGFSGTYYHTNISGRGVTQIPTLEKKAKEPSTIKDATNTSFKVEPIGDGEYWGFVLDGNHRYLLEDFTVTHNTYAAGGYFLLDYLRDPLYTTVKLAAINEDHLKQNLFAHVVTLFRACAIPSPHEIIVQDAALWMGIKSAGAEFGIAGLAFKQSQETSGQFKGYKAKPARRSKHPKFGFMTRLRVLGDEGQNWPGGPFKDFNSLIASRMGSELVKVAVSFNPESMSQQVVQMAEPDEGFTQEGVDTHYDYESKKGWRVCRLDAARCENVIQRRVIYPGLQTYEGFVSYLKAGGDNSPNYFTFARGYPPIVGTVNTIIPPAWPQSQRGQVTFIDTPINCAAIDLAFMGKDSAQMAIGRWGRASGWRDANGVYRNFTDRLNTTKNKPHHVLQIDQILPLTKRDDTIQMSEEIIARCRNLGIDPEWVAVDKTGIGHGTWSHLTKTWGDVFGISWNEKATEKKIIAEDLDGADKQCDGVMSEMWWAFRKWLDPRCAAVFINPVIPSQPIHTQLTSRRYDPGKNGIKVEAKDKYMARNAGVSPDEADALVMIVHVVRHMSDIIPGLEEQVEPSNKPDAPGAGTLRLKPMELVRIDIDDSISIEDKDG